MTREQFLSQYTGEWSPSDGHWFGLDFGWRGQEYRFQTDSMYHPANTVLPDGREARFGVYKKEGSAYALIGDMPHRRKRWRNAAFRECLWATFSKMNRQNYLGRTKVENDSSFPERESCFLQQINA